MHNSYIKLPEQDYANLAGEDWPKYENYITDNDVPEFVYKEINFYLEKTNSAINDAFCVLPFYGIEYPTKVSCCLMEPLNNSDELQLVKQQMLSGVKSNKCSACWRLENNSLVSDRIYRNGILDGILNKSINSIEEECRQGKATTLHYKIGSSISCNATCVTCGSQASSSWIKLEKKNNMPTNKVWQIKKNQLCIDYKNARYISFNGGESLLSDTNFDILESLLFYNNKDCYISFVTNGSIALSKKRQSILSKFNHVTFTYSIDGIGSVFEYLRFPLKWDTVSRNLKQMKDLSKFDINISYTLSNLNIMYHTETIKWFQENNLPYNFNVVYNPEHFNPSNLPLSVKHAIIDDNNKFFLDIDKDFDVKTYEQFKEEISKQDRWKNISMQNYLPKFYNLIESH